MAQTAHNIWNQRILQHESWLRTVIRSRVHAPDEVDDLFQTVLAQAMAYVDRQQEVRALGPWLYQLTVNSVLQFRRSSGRRKRLHDDYAQHGGIASESTAPLDLILSDEQGAQVRSALQHLTEEDAEILLLKYVHGWNYAQLGERLGVEPHGIAHRLRRARARLKHELQRRGIGDEEDK